MGRKKKNNPLAGILIGPALGFVALAALWHNEGRFDDYKAARATAPVGAEGPPQGAATVSVTGSMDRELTLAGDYVKSFRGYLSVRRRAEIYAWDKDEDSDGNVSYDLEWNSSVESISRNDGVEQRLRSATIELDLYQVGDRWIDGDDLAFVDPSESIAPGSLTLSVAGDELELVPEADYFYLRKGQPKNLGDERISYSGVPVPAVATYFGGMRDGRGVAHVAEVKTGWISALIHDTGILHHLAAGEPTSRSRR